MLIRFWGVRGSYPAPGPAAVQFGGNTICVEVRANNQLIILDAGTGIIALGHALVAHQPLAATLLFSHYHHDHTQGFPFFAPAYLPSTHLTIMGPAAFNERGPDAVLDRIQVPPLFPVTLSEMTATITMRAIQAGDTIVASQDSAVVRANGAALDNAVIIRAQRSYAHPGGVLHYRIEAGGHTLVYATDTEGYIGNDQRLVDFARGADVLIHDAQYTDEHYSGQRAGSRPVQGFGHSTAAMACAVAQAAEVGQLVLFHHDPTYDDATIRANEAHARQLFPRVVAASEGLEIALDDNATPTPTSAPTLTTAAANQSP